ncbi:MAG: tetratricopeptide repeat protein, partial [Erythrobacter sp.]
MSEQWQSLGQAASRALSEGRFKEASLLFRRVVELAPTHADSWFNLAYSLRNERRYEEAVDAYGRSLELGVAGPEEALVNRALIYSDHLYRTDLAQADLQAALAASPGFIPAQINLGMLQEDLGNREAAMAAYSGLLKTAPKSGRARARLATLSSDPETAIQDLTVALETIQMLPEDIAEVEFALGNLLDQTGRHDDAFMIIDRANQRMARLRPSHLRYDAAAHERLIAELIDTFCAPFRGQPANEGRRQIFICGMFRSGSTVAEQYLGRHPSISAAGELEYIPAFV